MVSRIIVSGRNKSLPRNAVQTAAGPRGCNEICDECDGYGVTHAYFTVDPSERPSKVSCPVCGGEGFVWRAGHEC